MDKTDSYDITEILLKVALNTINQPTNPYKYKTKDPSNTGLLFFFVLSNNICIRYDNVTLIPLVFQLGLRIDPIQRMGAN
jgi:hypothetical protein